jgi:hypothetical protein
MLFAMPLAAGAGETYIHFDFNVLGHNYREALTTIFTRPVYTATLLFKSHVTAPEAALIKTELHCFIMISGGVALLFRPAFLWMLLPIYGQKLFNDDFTKWGINHHYSIEFVPLISAALFLLIASMPRRSAIVAAFACIGLTAGITYKGMHYHESKWYVEENENLFSAKHYHRNMDVKQIHALLNRVPSNASLSVSNTLAPYVAFRKELYLFPYTGNADMILLLHEPESYYPLDADGFNRHFDELLHDSSYVLAQASKPFYMFAKRDLTVRTR